METAETPHVQTRKISMLAGVLLLAGLVVFGWAAPTTFNVYLMIHVVGAVVWVGGGVVLTILAMLIEGEDDPRSLAALVRKIEVIAKRVFIPTSLLVLLFGILMVVKENFDWGEFWIIVGLVGFALTFVTGIAFLTPRIEKFNRISAERGVADPEAQAVLSKLLLVARFDAAMLLLVVADMAAKPFA